MRAGSRPWLLLGGVVIAVGASIFAGIGFTLGDAADELPPAAILTLNALNSDMFFTLAVGTAVFDLALGLAVLRHGGLPRPLGWVALVIGIAGADAARVLRLPGHGHRDRVGERRAGHEGGHGGGIALRRQPLSLSRGPPRHTPDTAPALTRLGLPPKPDLDALIRGLIEPSGRKARRRATESLRKLPEGGVT